MIQIGSKYEMYQLIGRDRQRRVDRGLEERSNRFMERLEILVAEAEQRLKRVASERRKIGTKKGYILWCVYVRWGAGALLFGAEWHVKNLSFD